MCKDYLDDRSKMVLLTIAKMTGLRDPNGDHRYKHLGKVQTLCPPCYRLGRVTRLEPFGLERFGPELTAEGLMAERLVDKSRRRL